MRNYFDFTRDGANFAPVAAQAKQQLLHPAFSLGVSIAPNPPFPNCQFRICDLPGQCRGEGKCHHPVTVKPDQAERDRNAERYLAIRALAVPHQPPIDPNMSVAVILPWDDDKLRAPEAFDMAADAILGASKGGA